MTYVDADFNTSTLAAANLILNKTGTATATLASPVRGPPARSPQGITGDGALGISIAAETATDLAGNEPRPPGPCDLHGGQHRPSVVIGTPSAIYHRGAIRSATP